MRRFGHLLDVHESQHVPQPIELVATGRARRQVRFDGGGVLGLAVVLENQRLLGQVGRYRMGAHICRSEAATNGSSATRIFRTARKMLFFAASVLSPMALATSRIDSPST